MPIKPLYYSLLSAALVLSLTPNATGASGGKALSPSAARTQVEQLSGGAVDAQARSRYIIRLKQAPLAMAELAGRSIERLPGGRIDVKSTAAVAYVNELRAAQNQFLSALSTTFARPIAPISPAFQFQHAFNGMVLELSGDEAQKLSSNPEVAFVEADQSVDLDTDASNGLIGSPGVWDGSQVFGGLATRGEGTVVGIIDSGANLGSPSYAAVGGDGYSHTNPLGAGNYLGWCSPSNPNHVPARDICNAKMIGGWDFADALVVGMATLSEAPGFEDGNGHGSHTASTAAGNVRTGVFNGITRSLSGVAPHANLVIYDVCHTVIATGTGTCFTAASVAAANQVLVDGIVDVVNYSISGGTQPWIESVSQAFLGLNNAGVFVSTSAGNNGPVAGSLAHLEPWTSGSANSTHSRVFAFDFDLTMPGPVPGTVQNIPVRPGGAPIASATLSAPLIVSPNFANGGPDGCAPYPANFFRRPATAAGVQGLAVLRLDANTSACASGARRTAALNAGAAGTLFVDGAILGLGANATSYSMLLSDWNNVAAQIAIDPSVAEATISVPLQVLVGIPDAIANSSSRGPNEFSLLKPDVSAPGTEILAAYSRWQSAAPFPFGGAVVPALNDTLNVISGTSMASPHTAGAAALLRAINRSWTPSQIKSALVTTAQRQMTKQDFVTPADPFDYGGGRIDLSKAARAGLVMDETAANFTAANPSIGGKPSTLNLPSFQELSCVGSCTFARTVRSTRTAPVTWNATFEGFPAGAASLSPAQFTLANAATQAFTLSVDSLQLPAGLNAFGTLVLTPNNPSIPTARMSIAVRPALPDIDVSPTSLALTAELGGTASAALQVLNLGNPTLNWTSETTGTAPQVQLVQPNNAANGFSVNFYSTQTPAPGGVYGAEDHTPSSTGSVRSIAVEGFLSGSPATALNVLATQFTFKIYSDNAGSPAGNPEAGTAGEIYSCVRTSGAPNNAGLQFNTADGARFQLNLAAAAAAGCPAAPTLNAGTRYWFSVYPTVPGPSNTRRWVWYRGFNENGLPAMLISPLAIAGNPTAWTAQTPGGTPPTASFALTVALDLSCGAPWLSQTPAAGNLGVAGVSDTSVAVNAGALSIGTRRGFLCLDTNGTDPDEARIPVPVDFTIVDPLIFQNGFEGP